MSCSMPILVKWPPLGAFARSFISFAQQMPRTSVLPRPLGMLKYALVGFGGKIPRWRKGSELNYVVHKESFPDKLSNLIGGALKSATNMWLGIDVRFRQVGRNEPATFVVMYQDCNPLAYACSFFPDESKLRQLIVYPKSLEAPEFLANILAHEVGHILGLRHEFAHKTEALAPSLLIGSENPKSVMNYFDHPKSLEVKKEDLEELKVIYEHDKPKYKGWLISGY